MDYSRPCPAHTSSRRDIGFSDVQTPHEGPVKTVLVEFVEETRHRVRLQVPADRGIDDIEADLPNVLALRHEDGFVDMIRHIEQVKILEADRAEA